MYVRASSRGRNGARGRDRRMTGTTSTVNDLLNLLSRLRAEETTLREQFEGRLASLHKRIEAVQMTLEEFTGETHAADVEQPTEQPSLPLQLWAEDEARTPRPPTTTAWAQKLHGLTQIAALE